VAYIRMPPGQGSPSGVHQHDFEQYYYILQGTLTLEIGGEAPDAPAGSLLSILVGLPHQNVNRTDCDTIQLMNRGKARARLTGVRTVSRLGRLAWAWAILLGLTAS